MGIKLCPNCGSRNAEGGVCAMCGVSLGSVSAALVSAPLAALFLGAVWLGLAWATKFQLAYLAILYGGLVSGAVFVFSRGRGVVYQVIATFWTVMGMLVFDTLVVRVLWQDLYPEWGNEPLPSLLELMKHQVNYDPATWLFCILGVLGGLWLWSDPA